MTATLITQRFARVSRWHFNKIGVHCCKACPGSGMPFLKRPPDHRRLAGGKI